MELEREVEELRRELSEERAATRALEAGQAGAADRSGSRALLLQAAQAALRASEERYRTIFRASPAAIGVGSGGKILDANDRYCEFYGYRRDELIGRTVQELEFWVDPGDRVRMLERVREHGAVQDFATRFRRKDGSVRDALLTVETVEASSGDAEPTLLIMVVDVTQRRNLEEQLRQSQKIEAVGRLAGGIAHDFNNLLTAILGYSDILSNRFRVGDPERAEIHEIRRAAERAAVLTRQLLAFSRKQVLVPKSLDLDSVVRGLLKLLERLIGEDITVSLVVAPELGWVMADPGQMEQVVMNLAVNARDAMPNGGELLVEIRNVDLDSAFASEHIGVTPGPHVVLAVTDTGVGMEADVRKQIFEPFFTTKPPGEGTGLGLSTVHGIVNQSGGTIWVESEPGRGTTFRIYLPRVARTAAEPQVASGTFPALEDAGSILLVEDEEQVRHLASRILKLSGYTVLEARSAVEALALARGHGGSIQLLLTDVVMPGMSGPELAASFLVERPGVPVLYMSGYTDDAIVHHGVLEPGKSFLQKPFTPHGLVERVREVVRRAR